ncbi:hypothetical protein CBQ28_15475 [Pseudoalteromonas sp. GCY]|uniref:penicillin acylase family protein n=1 Tax=Pseudoalteromonas sp. GCY TaxID=2003316 RepID=UPI000BFEE467|nr:penicillin acylase family protein [Pseudoalteromonas sp. GCY]PHI36193.1 hypothetical protein CBQ28_15475 [Pseudoalteromonas sp. GCY]QQQ65450.1 penicillin acylase family protein [Pseudoalteromonas sp. GCY]
MNKTLISLSAIALTCLSGCSDDDKHPVILPPDDQGVEEPAEPKISYIIQDDKIFEEGAQYKVEIKRTTYGVPHIKANNLESAAFGNGYAQAEDNICFISDEIVRVNSERSKYHGPDLATFEDNINLMTDFVYKFLKLKEKAQENLPQLSQESQALIKGYVKGYNHYFAEAKSKQTLPEQCATAPWLRQINEVDVLTYLYANAISTGLGGSIFSLAYANPGDTLEWQPRPIQEKARVSGLRTKNITSIMDKPKSGFGSNAWGLGKEATENGKGILLANPHYPHSGAYRFWQAHMEIPGVLNVSGASLMGIPGIVNIGFNDNIAWTHTLSDATTRAFYQLQLKPGDRTTYLMDGKEHKIEVERIKVDALINGTIVTLEKDFYFTDHGPLIEAQGIIPWNDQNAYIVNDTNLYNNELLDHWLAVNTAQDLDSFKAAFKKFDGVGYTNTVYADKSGQSFYIDDTNVPALSDVVLTTIKESPVLNDILVNNGIAVVPAFSSTVFHTQAVPFDKTPQLTSSHYVQNSNDSHWATNLDNLLEGYSPLYGPEKTQLSLRTRMSLTMLQDSRGDDNKFSGQEVEDALFSNRIYFGETVVPQVIMQCKAAGDMPIPVAEGLSISVAPGCKALQAWNMKQDKDSIAGHLVRELASVAYYIPHLTVPFDPADPVNTPNSLTTDGTALAGLAVAMLNVQTAQWPLDAKLGDVQFVENVNVDGSEQRTRLPWAGTHEIEGGFNTFESFYQFDSSSYQKKIYPASINVATQQPLVTGLGSQGYQVGFGSSWIMVVSWDENGPIARGLLTHSQSTNPQSEHYDDQTHLYSEQPILRPIIFNSADISLALISESNLQVDK